MDRNELTAAIAGALAAAFLLGWIARWIFSRLNRAPREATSIAAQLHEADEARHRAEYRRAEAERRASEIEAELAQARAGCSAIERQLEEVRTAYREATAGRS
jgi:chromosome segregation ATPase